MTCGTCKHYAPDRNPITGRVRPSQPGACLYPVQWPALPQAYGLGLCGWDGPRWPVANGVWPASGERCEMHEPKAKR